MVRGDDGRRAELVRPSKIWLMLWPQATAERAIWRSGCSHGGMHTSIWYIGSKVTTWVARSP